MSFMSYISKGKRRYEPVNKDKYIGNNLPVIRSEWEHQFMKYCDFNPSVIKWSSESVAIPYYNPVRKKQCRYYPDFLIKVKDKYDREKTYLVEIKPYKEIKPPIDSKNKAVATKLYESATYMVNINKWKAAEDFCRKKNMTFRIITEKELFNER